MRWQKVDRADIVLEIHGSLGLVLGTHAALKSGGLDYRARGIFYSFVTAAS